MLEATATQSPDNPKNETGNFFESQSPETMETIWEKGEGFSSEEDGFLGQITDVLISIKDIRQKYGNERIKQLINQLKAKSDDTQFLEILNSLETSLS